MIVRLVPLLLVALSAAAETPADFASARALATPGEAAFYRLEVPAAVYSGTARADAGDLRVFNAAGEVVPYAWLPRPAATRERGSTVALPMFPLLIARGAGEVAGLSLAIDRTAAGTSIRVTSQDGKPATGNRLAGYVLDASAQDSPIVALTLRPHAPGPSFSTRIRVDASDDLMAWRTVVADAPLIDLEYAGRRLSRDRVEFVPTKAKYWRVTWPGAPADPAFDAIGADPGERVIEPARQAKSFAGTPVAGKDGDFEFDVGGTFPIERVALELPEVNSVVPAQLFVRASPKDEWRSVTSAVFYRLRQPGGEIVGDAVAVAAPAYRYWMARIDPKTGGLGRGVPSLRIEWRPQEIVFAARGAPPFALAWGSPAAVPVALAVATLVPGYDARKGLPSTVGPAQAGAELKAGDVAAMRAPFDWKRIVLWATLVIAALVLGTMGWRLAKNP
jgi:hypothetical protein